ncbi:MAG: hypothetical protein A3K09_07535 [Nitrospinae bacterium RIFCSPLOWO2_12_FULL_47_7]|nr:MAG: hypothetical protein A3K09_07535 [Nitrospinae bacterium RIFCSPLOWO2_12_FULL_47_7]
MNLITAFPKSPRDSMHGLVHLPRMIDKARAYKAKTLVEYIYPCPLDKIILNFIKSDAEEFVNFVNNHDETQILDWIKEKCQNRNEREKSFINQQILGRSPDGKERWDFFYEIRNKIAPSRTDITTWVDLIDLEEGRLQHQ